MKILEIQYPLKIVANTFLLNFIFVIIHITIRF